MRISTICWVFKKFKKVIVLVTLMFMLIGPVLNSYLSKPYYQASSILMVTGMENSQRGMDYDLILANKHFVKTYKEIVLSEPVLKQVATTLDFEIMPEDLKKAISVKPMGDTELLEIRVNLDDPGRAVDVANTTGKIFVNYVRDILGLSNVKMIVTSGEDNTSFITKKLFNPAVTGLVGLLISFGVCLTIEYVRQPIRGKEDVLRLPIDFGGLIPRIKGKGKEIYVRDTYLYPKIFNDLNYITLFLQRKAREMQAQTILVTSTKQGEGKSVVSSGLALAMARSGLKTTLIDANFRHPVQSAIFHMKEEPGLGNIFEVSDKANLIRKVNRWSGLSVVPIGSAVVEENKLFASSQFKQFLTTISKDTEIVLVDGPSILEDNEAASIISNVDAVLMVMQTGSSVENVKESLRRLRSIDAVVLGAVLNQKF